jgi:hypothetical protein
LRKQAFTVRWPYGLRVVLRWTGEVKPRVRPGSPVQSRHTARLYTCRNACRTRDYRWYDGLTVSGNSVLKEDTNKDAPRVNTWTVSLLPCVEERHQALCRAWQWLRDEATDEASRKVLRTIRFSTDLITALADGGYEHGPRAAMRAVPEPASFVMLLVGT